MARAVINLIIIVLIIVVFHDLSSTPNVVSATCQDQCLRQYTFYSQFYMSAYRLNKFKQLCMSKCPTEPPRPLTPRTTPKSNIYWPYWRVTKPRRPVTTRPSLTPKPPSSYWRYWHVTKAPQPATLKPTTRPTARPTTRPTPRSTRPYWQWWVNTSRPKPATQKPTTQAPTKGPLPEGLPAHVSISSLGTSSERMCGLRPAVTRIVGGSRAYECEFPWVVFVKSIYFCGGTILDHRHILTAAHCFKYRDGTTAPISNVQVKVGSSNFDQLQPHSIQSLRIHPQFVQGVNDYDVAILTLSDDLKYGACTAPVCLPDVDIDPSDSDGCWSAGWGVEYFNSRVTQKNLKKVYLPIIPNYTCKTAYGPLYVNDLKICAGDFERGGVDSCTGDSGGPLMCKKNGVWVQHGIVSFGRGCGGPRQPGVYTRLSHEKIRDFILETVQDIPG